LEKMEGPAFPSSSTEDRAMKSECEETREPKGRQEGRPSSAKAHPPIVPVQPFEGEAEDNLDRREDYFQKRHSPA